MRVTDDIRGALDEIVGTVCGIDDDPEPVAGADHLGAKVGQSAMHRRCGLDVTKIIDTVMSQLEVAQVIGRVCLVDPFN